MKPITQFGLIATGIAILHFAAAFVVALFLWLGEWGSGPQGGEVSITPEQRAQRDRMKPYEDAFMDFLRTTDKILALPTSLKGSRGLKSPRRAFVNSAIWGFIGSNIILTIWRRRSGRAQPAGGAYGAPPVHP
jgi:hypothetical protein